MLDRSATLHSSISLFAANRRDAIGESSPPLLEWMNLAAMLGVVRWESYPDNVQTTWGGFSQSFRVFPRLMRAGSRRLYCWEGKSPGCLTIRKG